MTEQARNKSTIARRAEAIQEATPRDAPISLGWARHIAYAIDVSDREAERAAGDDPITALAKRIDPAAWVDLPGPVRMEPPPPREFGSPNWIGLLLGVEHGEETEESVARRESHCVAQEVRWDKWRDERKGQMARREKAMDAARMAIALTEAQDMKKENADARDR
ncbi:MAG: hypothetical protein KAY22_20135 [Rhizorhabdus sp.]|uniref:hypothetical protein n=1 Tax=Rhizorhabdus sp. TaxID=1968843 RepID=UPI001B6C1BE1|nr:hypothetical protein [Rhizorhabdus sp.]MBP8234608.1 hypothetical protein [Rhizorhabdus sp.]